MELTVEQLGQKVKAKYPQYKSLSDAEVGKKVSEKYPEYKAMVKQPKSVSGFIDNILPSGANLVKDLASAAVNVVNPKLEENTVANLTRLGMGVGQKVSNSPVGNFIFPMNEINKENIKQAKAANPKFKNFAEGNEAMVNAAGDFYKQRYGGIQNIKDTAYEDPIGALFDLSTLLSAGGTSVAKAGQLTKAGKVAKAGEVAAKTGKYADPLTWILKGTGKSGSLAKGQIAKVGEKIEQTGKEIPLGGIRITPLQMQKFKKETGFAIEDYIKNNKLTGNPVEKGIERAESLQSKYDDLVLKSGKKISTDKFLSSFDDRIKELTGGINQFDPESQALVQKLQERRTFYETAFKDSTEIDVSDLVALRRLTDKRVTPSAFLADPDTANINVQVRRAINDTIYGAVPEAKQLGKDLNAQYKFNEFVSKTSLPSARNKLSSNLKIAGAAASGVAAMSNPLSLLPIALSYAGGKALQNPKILGNISTGVEITGSGIKNLGQTNSRMSALLRAAEQTNDKFRNTGARLLPR